MATRWSTAWLCSLGLLIGCAPLPGRPVWHQVTGGDFNLRSCGDAQESLALAADLREIRASLRALFPQLPERDRVAFSAVLFCRSSDYTQLAPDPAQGNHFVAPLRGRPHRVEQRYEAQRVATRTTVRGTRMAVREAQLRGASDLVRHHYVHHLVRAHLDVPLWIDEGLASFLGTTTREPGGVSRGRAASGMFDLVMLDTQVPLGRMMRATDLRTWPDSDLLFFYHDAWLLTHYLHFGSIAGEEGAGARLQRYAATFAASGDEQAAAESAFGRRPIGLRTALDRYRAVHGQWLRNGRRTAPHDLSGDAGLEVAALSSHDLAYGLAVFALENRDAELALRWFDAAVGADPGSAIAHSGRARAQALLGDWGAARLALARADERGPSSPRVGLDGAALLVAAAAAQGGGSDDRRAAQARAEAVARRQPELAEAHYWVASSAPDAQARRAALERAHAAAPGAGEVAFELARALAAEGRFEEARALGSRVAGQMLGELREDDVHDFLDALPETPQVAVRE